MIPATRQGISKGTITHTYDNNVTGRATVVHAVSAVRKITAERRVATAIGISEGLADTATDADVNSLTSPSLMSISGIQ